MRQKLKQFIKIVHYDKSIFGILNPLNSNSDKHLIPPYNNTDESFIKIMRIKEIISIPRSFDR